MRRSLGRNNEGDSGCVLRVAAGCFVPGRDFYDVHSKNCSSWILRLTALVCLAFVLCISSAAGARTQRPANDKMRFTKRDDGGCFRAAIGSEVPEPEDLRSVDGILKVDLAFRSFVDSKGEVRYCYVTLNGKQSPTLRVKPGDTVILNFKNEATAAPQPTRTVMAAAQQVASSRTGRFSSRERCQ